MSDLPIDSGTIAIAPVIGRTQVWMGANGGVAGTWVIYINDQNVLSIPQTQKWAVQRLAQGQHTLTHVASGLPVIVSGRQLQLGPLGSSGDAFAITQDPTEQIWRIMNVSDGQVLSIDNVSQLHGASAITTQQNFMDESQKFVVQIMA